MDLVPFYPRALYLNSSAPLHFLVTLRSTYVSLTHDPFFMEPAHEPWFQAFMYIEALVQFPLAVYLVYTLLKQGKGAATELAGLAFGCVTGMGSVTCCYVLAMTAEEVLSSEKRAMLFWGEYLPFAVIRELHRSIEKSVADITSDHHGFRHEPETLGPYQRCRVPSKEAVDDIKQLDDILVQDLTDTQRTNTCNHINPR